MNPRSHVDSPAQTSTQALVYDPAKPPTGSNVDTAKLAQLAQPFAQAMAEVA